RFGEERGADGEGAVAARDHRHLDRDRFDDHQRHREVLPTRIPAEVDVGHPVEQRLAVDVEHPDPDVLVAADRDGEHARRGRGEAVGDGRGAGAAEGAAADRQRRLGGDEGRQQQAGEEGQDGVAHRGSGQVGGGLQSTRRPGRGYWRAGWPGRGVVWRMNARMSSFEVARSGLRRYIMWPLSYPLNDIRSWNRPLGSMFHMVYFASKYGVPPSKYPDCTITLR